MVAVRGAHSAARRVRRAAPAAIVLAGAALLAPVAGAHKGHGKSPSPSAPPSAAASPAPGLSTPWPAAATPSPFPASVWQRLSWADVFYGHLHNKIVHFPLALGLAAAGLFLLSPRWPDVMRAGRVLLLVAALLAIAAYFTGQAQHEAFEHGPLEEVMELHRTMGITSGVTLWLGVALGAWPRGRRWLWLYACLLILTLGVTGTLGGILSHSEL